MRAKLVNEAIKHMPGRSTEEIDKTYGKIIRAVQKHFGYLDLEEPNISEDAELSIWFSVGIPEINDSIVLWTTEEDGVVAVKFYYDSVAFNGKSHNDEYTTWLEPIDINDFDETDYQAVLKDIKIYMGLEEED